MKRIIFHWTAGVYKASDVDKAHYHFLIDGDGNTVLGVHEVSDNESTSDDDYAAHTFNCNTGSIGVSLCCMVGAVEKPFNSGKCPMKKLQWDKMVVLGAKLCKQYGIKITPKTILSHAEVQTNLGIKQKGKWDFTRLAFDPSVVGAKACGDKLRREIQSLL
jgi:N-acetyl-anhydromuramyl-L-alanine amidase AmpD